MKIKHLIIKLFKIGIQGSVQTEICKEQCRFQFRSLKYLVFLRTAHTKRPVRTVLLLWLKKTPTKYKKLQLLLLFFNSTLHIITQMHYCNICKSSESFEYQLEYFSLVSIIFPMLQLCGLERITQ